MKDRLISFLAVAAMALGLSVRAAVVPNPLFSDNAILQQAAPVPVWGTANDGEAVTVEIPAKRKRRQPRRGSGA